VDAQASQSPPCWGHVQTCWTVALLCAFLSRRFHRVLSTASIRRPLAPTGLALFSPAVGSGLQARSPGRSEDGCLGAGRAAGRPRAGPAAVPERVGLALAAPDPFDGDAHAHGCASRPPLTNRRRAFFGALEVGSGQWFWTAHERKLAGHFVAFLQRLATQYPTGLLYLALDNAPTPTAKVVGKWLAAHPRVHVLWLPKYAVHEANPVERISCLMQSAVAADRLAGSSEELAAAARRFFTELAPHPVKLPIAA
jgi:hypothetical protein